MTDRRGPHDGFGGVIGRTVADSTPEFDDPPHPGSEAPNVVIVLLDDTGFAQFGCYGSDIDTPNVDALAAVGLQFTNFHVTPLCSPTRASLLTGRSQHAVGMRSVANFNTGFPNQRGHISEQAATVADVLGAEGYATFAVGKWHLAPMEQCSAAGPFDHWPLGCGFDRFYGFLDGETDQFHPDLVADNHPIDPPASSGGTPGYHVSEDLVDQSLRMISDSTGVRPDRPFFLYLAFGATHAPHQAPDEYLATYRGRFDEGWDVVRERWFERQLELGVIPGHTELAGRNPGVEPWDDLPENHRRLAARLQEAFAAFLEHTDAQIGRLVDGLRSMGRLDDTILVVLADNGASQEGGPFGVMHEMKFFNGILETPDEAIERIDQIGGPHSHTNYPWGWAQCGNTPFRWYKQNTHEGGVHVPMVWHWPNGLPSGGDRRRDQFVNVADIVPTIYDLVGIDPPERFRGVDQLPVTGASFRSILDDESAPAANTLQYFEMAGSRALVARCDDRWWKAVCKHQTGADYDTEPWELYDLDADPSECSDLAEANPDRLADLIELWWAEADRHGVLPLDDRTVELFGARFREHSPHPADRRYVYRPPMSPMPGQSSAAIGGRNWDFTARGSRESLADDGVLWAVGSQSSGISIFVDGDRFVVDYNAFDDHAIVESTVAVPTGSFEVGASFRRAEGRGGSIELIVDGEPAGRVDVPLYMRMITSAAMTIGDDGGSQVSERYDGPNPFAGELHEIEIQVAQRRRRDVAQAEANAEIGRQ